MFSFKNKIRINKMKRQGIDLFLDALKEYDVTNIFGILLQ